MIRRVEVRIIGGEEVRFGPTPLGTRPLDEVHGKPKAIYHFKCGFVLLRREQLGASGKWKDSPTAYEEAAKHRTKDDEILAQRQAELAEDRAQEDAPKGWEDWRDPSTIEL